MKWMRKIHVRVYTSKRTVKYKEQEPAGWYSPLRVTGGMTASKWHHLCPSSSRGSCSSGSFIRTSTFYLTFILLSHQPEHLTDTVFYWALLRHLQSSILHLNLWQGPLMLLKSNNKYAFEKISRGLFQPFDVYIFCLSIVGTIGQWQLFDSRWRYKHNYSRYLYVWLTLDINKQLV